MNHEQDRDLMDRVRAAAASLAAALNKASSAGLMIECSARPLGHGFIGKEVIEQSDWHVEVSAKRVYRV